MLSQWILAAVSTTVALCPSLGQTLVPEQTIRGEARPDPASAGVWKVELRNVGTEDVTALALKLTLKFQDGSVQVGDRTIDWAPSIAGQAALEAWFEEASKTLPLRRSAKSEPRWLAAGGSHTITEVPPADKGALQGVEVATVGLVLRNGGQFGSRRWIEEVKAARSQEAEALEEYLSHLRAIQASPERKQALLERLNGMAAPKRYGGPHTAGTTLISDSVVRKLRELAASPAITDDRAFADCVVRGEAQARAMRALADEIR